MKRVVVFGLKTEAGEYSRNITAVEQLKRSGNEVEDCLVPAGFALSSSGTLTKVLFSLFATPRRWVRLLKALRKVSDYDILFVPYPAYLDGCLAVLTATFSGKTVILDALYGLYDMLIRDRQVLKQGSVLAGMIWRYERWLLSSAHRIVVDTPCHARMFHEDYGIPLRKIIPVPVGIDELLWTPVGLPESTDSFNVFFWGTFIPLHGTEVILSAAELLENKCPGIRITLIGTGQTAQRFRRLLRRRQPANVTWMDTFIPIEELQQYVATAHCCLGVFAGNPKTHRVIPYKIHQSLASAKPVITAATEASATVLSDGKNALLIPPESPAALAGAIERLYLDRAFAMELGRQGRLVYEERLSNRVIGSQLKQMIHACDV